MLAALVIVFREVIEAGLIVGIVLAATTGVPGRALWVGYGVAGGLGGACLVAAFAGAIAEAFAGNGQELLNAAILLLAVVMLAWHNVWMARHGRDLATQMRAVGAAVAAGQQSRLAMAIVVGTAVLREGSEVVLFLYGVAVQGDGSGLGMTIGGAAGLAGGVGIAALMYLGLVRIPTRHLFTVTGWLITLLAAGMAAQAVVYLQQAGIVTALSRSVWNTSSYVSEASLFGKTLHTLVGYSDQPSGLQLAAYGVTVVTITVLTRLVGDRPRRTMAA